MFCGLFSDGREKNGEKMKVAVLGYGVVGSGVVEVLCHNKSTVEKNAGEPVDVKYILDIREFPDHPLAALFTKDFEKIVSDPEVDVVVEVIGGIEPAYTFVKRSLAAGKSVVTSNKELVAAKGDDLLQTARNNNVNFMFEASVGGGIPIIRPLTVCLAANRIERIYGVLNGTTNYILSIIIEKGCTFEEALKMAQQNGYAEANPAADIDGIDACRKIAILASLAFGVKIEPDRIPTEGIRGLEIRDVTLAKKVGYVIKLLGVCEQDKDGKVYAAVAPFLLPCGSKLAGCEDVFNEIHVEGDAVGETSFYGRGAGKLPTASAVVADIIDCALHKAVRKNIFWALPDMDIMASGEKRETSFYARFSGDADTIGMKLAAQKVISDENGEFAAIFPAMPEALFFEKVADLEHCGGIRLKAKYRLF